VRAVRQTGINVGEFEFPAYFNFFVLRKRLVLITTPEVEPLVRLIFQITLLGPTPEMLAEGKPTFYSKAVPDPALDPDSCFPDLEKEGRWFRKNPFDPNGAPLTVDTLIRFVHFQPRVLDAQYGDRAGATVPVAVIGGEGDKGTVEIHDNGEEYALYEREPTAPDAQGPAPIEELTTVSSYVIVSPPPIRGQTGPTLTMAGVPPPDPRGDLPDLMFVPPLFGITMLGTSHGFDAKGTTTGFVLWVNRCASPAACLTASRMC
jgi:hypothetical protein